MKDKCGRRHVHAGEPNIHPDQARVNDQAMREKVGRRQKMAQRNAETLLRFPGEARGVWLRSRVRMGYRG